MRISKGTFNAIMIVWTLISLAFLGLGIYVIHHFVMKYW